MSPTPLPESTLHVEIRFSYSADLPVTQFEILQQIVEALQSRGVNPTVMVSATDPPPATRTRAPRGGNKPSNGQASPSGATPNDDSRGTIAAAAGATDDVAGDTNQPDDEGDDIGLPNASTMSPEECLEQALGIARHLYNANHKDATSDMMKKFNVKKFNEIPVSAGPELYKLATEWAEKKGMRV